jgi:hypothetical protein
MLEVKRMFLSKEWDASAYHSKLDGQDIARLVYEEGFWIGLQEVCAIIEPLLKVLLFVACNG